MHRALSTENLGIGNAFTRIRRMLRPGTAEVLGDDIPTLTRTVEDMVVKQGGLGTPDLFAQLFASFDTEVSRLLGRDPLFAQPPEDPPAERVASPRPEGAGPPALTKQRESALASFLELLPRLPAAAVDAHAAAAAVETQLVANLLAVAQHPVGLVFNRRLSGLAVAAVRALFAAHPQLLLPSCGAFHRYLTADADPQPEPQSGAAEKPKEAEAENDEKQTPCAQEPAVCQTRLTRLRLLAVLHDVFCTADLAAPELSNEAKAQWAELGAIEALLRLGAPPPGPARSPTSSDAAVEQDTEAVVATCLLGALYRSNLPIKAEVLGHREAFLRNWGHAAESAQSMRSTLTVEVRNPVSGKAEAMDVTLDPAVSWAGELSCGIIELCTGGSFTLTRQAAGQQAPTAQGEHRPPRHVAWEPLPVNWDAMLASAGLLQWRLASALGDCVLSEAGAEVLLDGLASLPTEAALSRFVFNATGASVLCLCRATLRNCTALRKAGAFRVLLGVLSPHSRIFRRLPGERLLLCEKAAEYDTAAEALQALGPELRRVGDSPAEMAVHHTWNVTAALVTLLLSTEAGADEVRCLMAAVSCVVRLQPVREDCDAIETCFAVLAATTYAPRCVWFNGGSSRASCRLSRFCGRWYGYSVTAWVDPCCVWPEGGLLLAVRDTQLSSVLALCIVANGKSRCLAARTSAGKDRSSRTLLPDAVIGDGWQHVAVVHNISGFTVFVNGRKCGSSSVAYPKEPAKGHRLTVDFGGSDSDLHVPPFFGRVGSMQLLEGALTDKDVDRLAALGPCSETGDVADPPLSHVTDLAKLSAPDCAITGSAVHDAALHDVSGHAYTPVAEALGSTSPIGWALRTVHGLASEVHRSTMAILCLELVAGYMRQRPQAFEEWDRMQGTARIGAELLSWGQLAPEVISALFPLILEHGSTVLRDRPITTEVLLLVFDLMAAAPPDTKVATLRELSELFNSPRNAAFFNKHVGVGTLLALADSVSGPCTVEFVNVAEKLVKQPPEVEAVLHFLVAHPPSPRPTPQASVSPDPTSPLGPSPVLPAPFGGDRAAQRLTTVKGELLRMLYDVAKAHPPLVEVLVQAGASAACLALVSGTTHDSEALRVYALRLQAMLLHCHKKHREQFVRGGGFAQLGANLLRHHRRVPAGLPTFNCLFKMALDFYQPGNDTNAAVLTKLRAPPAGAGPRTTHADPAAAEFSGDAPPMVHVQSLMCRSHTKNLSVGGASSDFGGGASDLDARLSVDDQYQSHATQRDTVAYPQCVSVALELLAAVAESVTESQRLTTSGLEMEAGADGVGADTPALSPAVQAETGSSHASSTTRLAAGALVCKVLSYLDRMLDISHNVAVLLQQPWLEWLWAPVQRLLPDPATQPSLPGSPTTPMDVHRSAPLDVSVEALFRRIVRKMAAVDVTRAPKALSLRRLKELPDSPRLQCIALEETFRHFAANQRLDTLDSSDAGNVIRNVEGLLSMAEDGMLLPVPLPLGIEMVRGVGAIAVHNPSWVRHKMKSAKVFDARDRFALMLLTAAKDLSQERPEAVEALREVVAHDPNAVLFLLRSMTEAVRDHHVERFEAAQAVLRTLYAVDDDQRRAIVRIVGDAEVCDSLVLERRVVDGAEVLVGDFLTWVLDHEARWGTVAARVLKASKTLDADTAARHEKREKDHGARLKLRRADAEKRRTADEKTVADAAKAAQEVTDRGEAAMEKMRSCSADGAAARAASYDAAHAAAL